MIETFRAVLDDNTPAEWITAGVILVAGALVVTLLRRRSIVLAFFRKRAERGDGVLAPFVVDQYLHTLVPVLYAAVVYVALSSLKLTPGLRHGLNLLQGAIVVYGAFRLLVALAVFSIRGYASRREGDRIGSGRSIHALVPIVQLTIWGVGIVFLLENFGFRVEAIITGLGIGGVAVALAAQSVLRDVFSYVAIVFDRPFELGDMIQADAFIGTVEYIGLKTTHVRSQGGEQIIFANSDITGSRVLNWKRMAERRVVFGFTVVSDTTADELTRIASLARAAVETQADTRFERAHFASFGDAGLTFEVVYYVLSSDYNLSMDRRQAINLALKEGFERQGVRLVSQAAAPAKSGAPAEDSARTTEDEASRADAVAATGGAAAAMHAAQSTPPH